LEAKPRVDTGEWGGKRNYGLVKYVSYGTIPKGAGRRRVRTRDVLR
jgi:hypothetical protein